MLLSSTYNEIGYNENYVILNRLFVTVNHLSVYQVYLY